METNFMLMFLGIAIIVVAILLKDFIVLLSSNPELMEKEYKRYKENKFSGNGALDSRRTATLGTKIEQEGSVILISSESRLSSDSYL